MKDMIIRIVAQDQTLSVQLENSAAAQDFAALLPLELNLSDYNRTEKIADLPRRLSTEGSPSGTTPVAGDLAYYAPWGNLAIFYRDFAPSPGLVGLGKVDANAADISSLNGLVRFELQSASPAGSPPLPDDFTSRTKP